MLRQAYNRMNENLSPSDELLYKTLEQMEGAREKGKMGRHANGETGRSLRIRRLTVGAVTAVMIAALSLTAFAAAVPEFGRFLQSLLPRYGNYLQPVSEAKEQDKAAASEQGISLKVAASVSDRDRAEIFFTLTDEKGRINKDTRVTGELTLDGETTAFTAAPVDYDEMTKTASYRQQAEKKNGVDGCAASLTITGILGEQKELPLNLDLGSLKLDEDPRPLSYTLSPQEDALAKTYPYRYEKLVQNGDMALLMPQTETVPFAQAPEITLTGAAYLDGNLHLQFRIPDYWRSALIHCGGICSDETYEPGSSYDSHPFSLPFTLEEDRVNKVWDGSVESRKEDGSAAFFRLGNEYLEVVDALPRDALPFWSWNFSYVTYETAVQGTWSQNFTLQSASDSLLELSGPFTVQVETKHLPENRDSLEFDSTYAPAVIDSIRITPLGITLSRAGTPEDKTPINDGILKRIAPDLSKLQVTVRTSEGEFSYQLDLDQYTFVPDEEGNMTAVYRTETPVDPEKIISLTINDTEISLPE